MPKPEDRLYFIALLPSTDIHKMAQEWKEEFAQRYDSHAALKSPPHITLHMPFRWKERKEGKLEQVLTSFATDTAAPTLRFDGFGAFPPRVIYIHVAPDAALMALQAALHRKMKRSLYLFNADYRSRPFKPHLTLAFRDLKKEYFEAAWSRLGGRPFSATCTVPCLSLLKHNGKHWEVLKAFAFGH